jgi:sugar lactone lactonase YvrE
LEEAMKNLSSINVCLICFIIFSVLSACSPSVEILETSTLEVPATITLQETGDVLGETPTATATPEQTRDAVGYFPAELTEPLSGLPGNVILPSGESADYFYRAELQIPLGLAWGPDDLLYIADMSGHRISTVSFDGKIVDLGLWQTLRSMQEEGPVGITFDSGGNLYFHNGVSLLRIDQSGEIDELFGIPEGLIGGIAFSSEDELYFTLRNLGMVYRWIDGESVLVASFLPNVENLVFGQDGSLYVTQMSYDHVMKIDPAGGGDREIFAKGVCPVDPCFLAVDPEGDIWVRGLGSLHQFSADGKEKNFIIDGETYPGGPISWYTSAGIAFDRQGGLWLASYNSKLTYFAPLEPGTADPAFESRTISPGLEAWALAFDSSGAMYASDSSGKQILKFTASGTAEVFYHYGFDGHAALAVDELDRVYIGLPTGEIKYVDQDGNAFHFADLLTRRMVVGGDGVLYAVIGDYNQPKQIARITGVDAYTFLASEIAGIPLGDGELDIAAAGEEGLYIIAPSYSDLFSSNVFYLDFKGNGYLTETFTLPSGAPGMPFDTVPGNGGIIFLSYIPNNIYRLIQGSEPELLAARIVGDPTDLIISPDGKWVYVAESGAINKIPIP